MSNVSSDDIAKLASLSGLALSDDEMAALGGDIEKIIQYIDQLQELDTDNIEPTYMVVDKQNVWREDEVAEDPIEREALLSLAPDRDQHYIKVPKVL